MSPTAAITGSEAITAAVGSDPSVVEATVLVAVTKTRSPWPTSVAVGT